MALTSTILIVSASAAVYLGILDIQLRQWMMQPVFEVRCKTDARERPTQSAAMSTRQFQQVMAPFCEVQQATKHTQKGQAIGADNDGRAVEIDALMAKHGTDKGSSAANYHHMYAGIVDRIKFTPNLTMLEVGANRGNSLHFWADFFTDVGSISGMRYGIPDSQMATCSATFCSKVRIYDGDQSKTKDLLRVVRSSLGGVDRPLTLHSPAWSTYGYDFIVDDGSHVPQHMLLTFYTLFPYLKPGGIYVIEDTGFAYCDSAAQIYGYTIKNGGIGRQGGDNLVEWFKQLADHPMRRHTIPKADFTVFSKEIDEAVWNVEFVSGCVVIYKKTAAQYHTLNDHVRSAVPTACYMGKALADWKQLLSNQHIEGLRLHP